MDNLRANLQDNLVDNLGDNLQDNLGDNLQDNLRDNLWANLGDMKIEWVDAFSWGQWDIAWISYYTFPDRFIHPMFSNEDRALLSQWERLTRSCGWIYALDGICFICDRPTEIHQNERNLLHCETGPALAFSDGYAVFAYKGVRVPAKIIENPEMITCSDVLKEKNVEVRRVMIERYGQSRFLTDSGSTLLHEDETGKLWERRFKDDEPMLMVEVINSTPEPDGEYKTYFLRVHPEIRLMHPDGSLGDPQPRTAHSAIASTFGKTAQEYHPLVQT